MNRYLGFHRPGRKCYRFSQFCN